MMKKRLKKKMYRRYAFSVMAEVSAFHPEGPGYRGVMARVPELTGVALDTSDPRLFSPAVRVPCQRYGLHYLVYRAHSPEWCVLVFLSAERPQIFEFSWNNLTRDEPLARYRLAETHTNFENWGRWPGDRAAGAPAGAAPDAPSTP